MSSLTIWLALIVPAMALGAWGRHLVTSPRCHVESAPGSLSSSQILAARNE